MPTDSATPPAAAPAAPAWTPKRGDFVNLTETEPRTKKVSTHLLLITGTTTARGPKRDKKGNVVTEVVGLPVGPTKEIRQITRAVLEDVTTFEGVSFSAQAQFPVSKRGISIAALSPLEG